MNKDDLRFLLKDKYNINEVEFSSLDKDSEIYNQISLDIKLLNDGVPRDYVIGFTEFLGCHIDLSLKPLIPRVETEYWVEKLISELRDDHAVAALDIFCGSGCIGIALLEYKFGMHVTFADISQKALDQTTINLKNYELDSYEIVKSDVWENIEGEFDLIVANPPYIGINDEVEESTSFEPSEALFAGEDGLDLIREFLNGLGSHLSDEGQVWMEFGSEQKDKIQDLLLGLGFTKFKFHKDQFDRWRWVVIN